jgi:hypothetical protein
MRSFLDAWLRAFANALQQATHKFTDRSKDLTDMCIIVGELQQSSHLVSVSALK